MHEKIMLARDFWRENALDKFKAVLLIPAHTSENTPAHSPALSAAFLSAVSMKTGNFAVISDTDIDTGGVLIKTTGEMIDNIISLYLLYRFTDKLIVASFTQPFGEKLQNLYQSGIITLYDYAKILTERL